MAIKNVYVNNKKIKKKIKNLNKNITEIYSYIELFLHKSGSASYP